MSRQSEIRLKRVYEPASVDDGLRALVDRLWPRGVRRDELAIDLHAKELAPSTELRRWFGHDPRRFDEFRQLYLEELEDNLNAARALLARAKGGRITLLFAARDRERNHAIVLRDFLEQLDDAERSA